MTRRDALLRLAALFGGTIFGAPRFLASPVPAATTASEALGAGDLALLNEVAETILPATADSPGAKAADVAAFMQEIARDFYDERERAILLAAPARFNEASAVRHGGRTFLDLTGDERYGLLLELDAAVPPPEYYQMVKQLTLWGYWTSETGATQALNHLPVPGMYQGCIPLEPGTKAWAN